MLNAPEKPVCVVECQHFIVRKEIQLTECAQSFEHARFLEERMTRTVNELKRRHDEFDFANAANTKFDVALELVGSHHVALNAPLDIGDLVEQIGRGAPGINKRLMLP